MPPRRPPRLFRAGPIGAALREKIPSELFDLVAAAAKQPVVEDLDI